MPDQRHLDGLPDNVAEELARLRSMPRNEYTVTHIMELWSRPQGEPDRSVLDEIGLARDLERLRAERDLLASRLFAAERDAANIVMLQSQLERVQAERQSLSQVIANKSLKRRVRRLLSNRLSRGVKRRLVRSGLIR